jgi:GH15 family glucan-1,4-alpha-glucosidase
MQHPYGARIDAGPFPQIRDYGFLSDCEVSALVAPGGAVEWLCLPRPDAPSVFGALLDRSAGAFHVAPTHALHPSHRRYLPGTMVLETTWQTPTGWAVVRDCLVMQPWPGGPRPPRYRRAPGDLVAAGTLLRTVTCLDGLVEIALTCLPQFDYARADARWTYAGDGFGAARLAWEEGGAELLLTTDIPLGLSGAIAYGHATLHDGDRAFVALRWGDGDPITTPDEADTALERTARSWRDWLQRGRFPDHPWRSYLERSALTLKGLSYAPTGAILAAATTSLPETPGGERNWDYRYSWVRDSSFMLRGLLTLGFDWEAYEFFAFMLEAAGGDGLQIMYGVGGERDLTESTLDHLSGYDGARPVRIGNGAWDQQQHDVWGMLLDSVAIHARYLGQQLPASAWEVIARLVERAAEVWSQPDRGIWEVRGEPRHFTASKALCWVAMDRGARLAEARGDADRAHRWRETAEEIHAEVCDRGVDERGVFVQRYDSDALDASTLLIPLLGFLPPDDDRVRATVHAIADELTKDGLVLRYRVEHTDDGLAGEEGTFTICSFWLVSALAMIGDADRARALCEKLLALASPLQLYAEELDPATGRHLGNFPQAFTHLALIDAVSNVIGPADARV